MSTIVSTGQTAAESIAETNALANLGVEAINALASIVKEVARVAINSPLASYFLVMLLTDISEKKLHLIGPDTGALVKGVATAAMGVDIATDVISAAAPFKFGGASSPDVVKPSAQVLVIGGDSDTARLTPLLQGLLKK